MVVGVLNSCVKESYKQLKQEHGTCGRTPNWINSIVEEEDIGVVEEFACVATSCSTV